MVIRKIPDIVSEINVDVNNPTYRTAPNTRSEGATALFEERGGYGYACLCGIDYTSKKSKLSNINVFMDGGYSDYPEELVQVDEIVL